MVLAVVFTAKAQEQNTLQSIKSPDGRMEVAFNLGGTENPTYSVKYDNKVMLQDSPIGIMLDMGSKPTLEGLPQGREAANGDFTKNLTVTQVKTTTAKTEYELNTIKQAKVSHDYVQCVFTLANSARQEIEFEFRISNNDIAIRYNIPKPRQRASTRVLFENTGFSFPDGTTTFLTPQSDAMIGWQRSKPSYEEG